MRSTDLIAAIIEIDVSMPTPPQESKVPLTTHQSSRVDGRLVNVWFITWRCRIKRVPASLLSSVMKRCT
ncbi:hypothetical protein PILCRDRAFT_815073 [Piloderma croceum F 1598]|uniref:Uncharacterized protein n=1 Tax=Piloderma croceum (strain F 1598) TaxID=765440 RepID=A0A0C3BM32_PILCF|nr:hypothetical protein PILCRDRAFT_815073 [Piloderma croceum F 1598]